jgi:sugar phosphate isomerase/epimerase
MAFTGAWDREVSVGEHVSSLREQVRLVKEIGREVEKGVPHVTVHSGRDWFTLKEAVEFYREAVRIEEGEGVVLAHETHRGRVFFNPWRTAEVLREVPGVKLCCDFSHWVVVAERLLGGCEAEIGLAAERCVHVHTRVGYGQGPQVPDPAAPEYAGAVAAHFGWWKTIWKSQRERGMKVSTFTPEFGPPEYLHTLPYTGVPVADLGRVCEWMRERVVGEFGE